jgi:SET domain-containing protein
MKKYKIRKPLREPAFKLQVKRSKAGLGLYAGEVIPRGKYIIEYFGEIIDDDTADEHAGKYLFEVKKNVNIDGTTRENTARYINHACRPNCEIYYYKERVMVRSLRKIKEGEELSYDYGTDYFEGIIGGKKRCRCPRCVDWRKKQRAKK